MLQQLCGCCCISILDQVLTGGAGIDFETLQKVSVVDQPAGKAVQLLLHWRLLVYTDAEHCIRAAQATLLHCLSPVLADAGSCTQHPWI
jgi:hypothetical protein